MDSLTFGVLLVILVAWVFSWGLIAAVVATAKQRDTIEGFVQGLMFGPVGVLFVALSTRSVRQRFESSRASGSDYGSEREANRSTRSNVELYK
jgi:hypothetical protein